LEKNAKRNEGDCVSRDKVVQITFRIIRRDNANPEISQNSAICLGKSVTEITSLVMMKKQWSTDGGGHKRRCP
jgi:hypothetical protein